MSKCGSLGGSLSPSLDAAVSIQGDGVVDVFESNVKDWLSKARSGVFGDLKGLSAADLSAMLCEYFSGSSAQSSNGAPEAVNAMGVKDGAAPTPVASAIKLPGGADDYPSPAPDLFVYEFEHPELGVRRSLSSSSYDGLTPSRSVPYWRERFFTQPANAVTTQKLVAVVEATKAGLEANILPDISVKAGDKLFAEADAVVINDKLLDAAIFASEYIRFPGGFSAQHAARISNYLNDSIAQAEARKLASGLVV